MARFKTQEEKMTKLDQQCKLLQAENAEKVRDRDRGGRNRVVEIRQ